MAALPGRAQLREPRAGLEHAEQVETDDHEEQRQHRHEDRRLQLEAPAGRLAQRSQPQQDGRQHQEADHHTQAEHHGMATRLSRLAGRRLGKGKDLEPDDREHAGHQVEDEATNERAQNGASQCQPFTLPMRARQRAKRVLCLIDGLLGLGTQAAAILSVGGGRSTVAACRTRRARSAVRYPCRSSISALPVGTGRHGARRRHVLSALRRRTPQLQLPQQPALLGAIALGSAGLGQVHLDRFIDGHGTRRHRHHRLALKAHFHRLPAVDDDNAPFLFPARIGRAHALLIQLQRQAITAFLARDFDELLGCHGFDHAAEVRQEQRRARGLALRDSIRQHHHRLAAALPPAHGRRFLVGHRCTAASSLETGRLGPVGLGHAAHRHVQLQRCLAGNADLLADQPFGLDAEARLTALEAVRQRHVTIDEGLALVAIVGQRPDGQPLGRRPADVGILRVGRPLDLEAGGIARVARIAPVGMPVRIVPQPHADAEGLARHHLAGIRDQLHLERAHALRAGLPVQGRVGLGIASPGSLRRTLRARALCGIDRHGG